LSQSARVARLRNAGVRGYDPGMVSSPREYQAPDGLTYRLALEERHGYLFAEVTGPQDSLEASVAYWLRLADEARARGTRRMMVVDRLEGTPLDPTGMAMLVTRLVGYGLEQVRIAYVEPTAEHMPAMEHGEIFAAELGFQARVFGDVGHADRWLRYGSD
jgi:hypothetical protein